MHPREIWNTVVSMKATLVRGSEIFWQTWRCKHLFCGSHGQGSPLWSQQHIFWVLGSGCSDISAGKVLLCGWCFFWLLISDCVISKLSSLVLLEILYQLCLNNLGGFCFLQLRKPGLFMVSRWSSGRSDNHTISSYLSSFPSAPRQPNETPENYEMILMSQLRDLNLIF